jgi:hypothetical protein
MIETQPQPSLRALKTLVAGMGILIVLGTAVVIGVIIHRIYAVSPPPSNQISAPAPFLSATLPPGSDIMGIAPAGAKLAIWTKGPDGGHVYIYDPAAGTLTQALTTPNK